MAASKWWRIGATLMFGLFVAYLDRANLSVGLPGLSRDLGFAGASFASTSSWALTAFLFGYLAANLVGGFLTSRLDPKATLVVTVVVFSLSQLLTGWIHSVGLLIALRIVLGFAEGVYWPQQFRLAKAWFTDDEMTKGTALIQYYGQYLALALGFFLLTPIYDHLGWRPLFWITGAAGLLLVVPLYAGLLTSRPSAARPAAEAATDPAVEAATATTAGVGKAPAAGAERTPGPGAQRPAQPRPRLTLAALGGPPFLLLVFSYFANGVLFWGITLWIPLVAKSFGFTGMMQGLLSALPYLLSLALTVPLTILSDRTGRRLPLAASGLFVGGVLMTGLPLLHSPSARMAVICIAMGYFTATYTSNLWAIVVADLDPHAVGPATGIINGFGAGGGGIVAGFVVGHLLAVTGSYLPGFVVLGCTALLGGCAVVLYGRVRRPGPAAVPTAAPAAGAARG
jgi:MFS family permease